MAHMSLKTPNQRPAAGVTFINPASSVVLEYGFPGVVLIFDWYFFKKKLQELKLLLPRLCWMREPMGLGVRHEARPDQTVRQPLHDPIAPPESPQ
jgi:hypothetical protein